MRISFQCHNCEELVEVESDMQDSTLVCKKCGKELMVPTVKLARDTLAMNEMPKALSRGDKVGGFVVQERLNAGGMGTIYIARQMSMDRNVALKVLSPIMARDSANIERFLSEVRLQARLDHPNIVPAFEAGYQDGVYYLAMSFVDGDSLNQVIKDRGPLSERQAIDIAIAVGKALAYAWDDHHILHRDIKPSNIIVDRKGVVRLLDLGISKCISDNSALTQSGVICGTPQYMSPEQATAEESADARSDIYSLGATLYHLVTGQIPFIGNNSVDILHKHLHQEPKSPEELRPGLSKPFCNLLLKMLAKKPADRPQTWSAVVAEFEHLPPPPDTPPMAPPPIPEGVTDSYPQPEVFSDATTASASDKVKTGLGWAAKGLLLSCALWGVFCAILVAGFVYMVYSVLTGPGCTVTSTGNTSPPVGTAAELRQQAGDAFSMAGNKLTIEASAKGGLWASKATYEELQIHARLRVTGTGEEAGLFFCQGSFPTVSGDWDDEMSKPLKLGTRREAGKSIVVLYRGEFGARKELGRGEVKPDADGWIELEVTKDGNSLRVVSKGTMVVECSEMFEPPDDDEAVFYDDACWGVYALPNTKLEVDFGGSKPTAPPAGTKPDPSGAGTDSPAKSTP